MNFSVNILVKKMEKMNVGVIGVGYWGKKIASEYALMCKSDLT